MRASTRLLLALAVLLVAFALRVNQLDAQSLWGDEGWAIYHASPTTPSGVIQEAYFTGNHTPLYFLLLHYWMRVGRSAFLVRFPSVLVGVVSCAALMAVGRHLAGRGAALLSGTLLALSPFHVYYSQEARMYALAVAMATLASLIYWRLHATPTQRTLVRIGAYGVSGALAVYAHPFSAAVLAAHAVHALIALVAARARPARWKAWLTTTGGQALATLLFLPWLIYAWDRIMGVSQQVDQLVVPFSTVLLRCLESFSVSVPILTRPPTAQSWAVLIPFLLAATLGLFWLTTQERALSATFLFLWAIVPILAITIVGFPPLPGWTRYFAVSFPPFCLLLAVGIVGLRPPQNAFPTLVGRAARLALPLSLALLLALGQLRSLHAYFTDSDTWRWDYRGAIGQVADGVRSGDAVIVQGQSVMFDYYFPAHLPRHRVPSVCDHDEERIRRETATIAADYGRVWVVGQRPSSCDPYQRASQWLKENSYQVSETWLESTIIDLYLTPREVEWQTDTISATFGGFARLRSVAISDQRMMPGDTVAVALEWHALHTVAVNYKLFLVAYDDDGQVVAHADGMPLNWLRPTSTWKPDGTIQDRWGLRIGSEASPGSYPLRVGFYDAATGERLPIQVDSDATAERLSPTEAIDELPIATLTVVPVDREP